MNEKNLEIITLAISTVAYEESAFKGSVLDLYIRCQRAFPIDDDEIYVLRDRDKFNAQILNSPYIAGSLSMNDVHLFVGDNGQVRLIDQSPLTSHDAYQLVNREIHKGTFCVFCGIDERLSPSEVFPLADGNFVHPCCRKSWFAAKAAARDYEHELPPEVA